jgi:ribulose-phosphate 3-epimerase
MKSRRPPLADQFLRDRDFLINPSLLSSNFARLETELHQVEKAGCTWVHLDVMDGHFVPNLTFGPPVVKSMSATKTPLFLDTHLMIQQPERYIEPFAKAGAHLITFHVEAEGESKSLVDAIHELDCYAGISVKPKTPLDDIANVLPLVDLVLVMTVEPGFGGQSLIPTTLNKVRKLHHLKESEGYSYLIEVDGGINRETAPLARAAGAEVLVAGSAVFGQNQVVRNVRGLRDAITGGNAE